MRAPRKSANIPLEKMEVIKMFMRRRVDPKCRRRDIVSSARERVTSILVVG